MTGSHRDVLRGAAVLQFALALACALYALLFVLSPHGYDELGFGPSLDLAYGLASAGAALLFFFGGRRAWRGSGRWWLPGLIAIVAAPLFILAFLLAAESLGG